MLPPTSPTSPCSGGSPLLSHNLNHQFRAIWGEFVDQLNIYFRQPNLAQASEHTLRALKMYNHQHVNKYMIEFSEHATHTGWNDVALYGELYRGLVEHI